jgi:raffinose/stachyose/melibiose transport system permease protein
MVVPTIVTLLIWIFMYTPAGGVNSILEYLGLHQLTLSPEGLQRSWLGDYRTALAAVLFVGFPWVAPVNMLIFLAGLEAIEIELVDAAKVDGARGWKMFWFIELPMVVGQIRLIVVTGTIGVMQGFQNILVMTGGGLATPPCKPAMRMYDTVMTPRGGSGTAPQAGFWPAIWRLLFLIIMIVTLFNLVGDLLWSRICDEKKGNLPELPFHPDPGLDVHRLDGSGGDHVHPFLENLASGRALQIFPTLPALWQLRSAWERRHL